MKNGCSPRVRSRCSRTAFRNGSTHFKGNQAGLCKRFYDTGRRCVRARARTSEEAQVAFAQRAPFPSVTVDCKKSLCARPLSRCAKGSTVSLLRQGERERATETLPSCFSEQARQGERRVGTVPKKPKVVHNAGAIYKLDLFFYRRRRGPFCAKFRSKCSLPFHAGGAARRGEVERIGVPWGAGHGAKLRSRS